MLTLIVVLAPTIFWLWMFRNMLLNGAIPVNERLIWVLGFIFLNLPTAVFYYFTVFRAKNSRTL